MTLVNVVVSVVCGEDTVAVGAGGNFVARTSVCPRYVEESSEVQH